MKSINHFIYQIAILSVTGFLFLSCNKTKDDTPVLSGKFVNQTYLQQIPDSIPGLVSAYCYEMNFISSDSVKILYGFEDATLGYKREGSHYVLLNALQNNDIPFEINENGTITLADSSWNASHENSVFSKSTISGNDWDFANYLNQRMIAGEYNLLKKDQTVSQKVEFHPNGTVTGLENFTSYIVCYSGDCVQETYPVANNITFTNDKKETFVYAFNLERKNKILKIYNVENPVPDIKGQRAIKELAFELRF